MARATEAEVKEIIGTPLTNSQVAPFLTAATLLVDGLLADEGYPVALLAEIERWLAAHFVAVRDPRVSREAIGQGTTAFHGQSKLRLDHTPYGQQVMLL